ncbi:MAG TPA: hypothetical protein VNN79_09605 [Actinomycetota bacterium]|nr:hypothetical protein [Actinomycetota bacterium]
MTLVTFLIGLGLGLLAGVPVGVRMHMDDERERQDRIRRWTREL